jgi:hypothetical protein
MAEDVQKLHIYVVGGRLSKTWKEDSETGRLYDTQM